MTDTAATVIIPTYNHAPFLADAIESALAQTVRCEVLVADDGSTDDTESVLARFGDAVRVLRLPHRGVAAARNAGIEAASSEFVMFLDADDIIAPHKIERQLAAFAAEPRAGWVLCDVRIIDEASGKDEPASARYAYAAMVLDGLIGPHLEERNFIPVMSPLVRLAAIFGPAPRLRFPEGALEDWRFWRGVAYCCRAAYVPEVLATYRHRKTGRSRGK